jgi:hypothetical protein
VPARVGNESGPGRWLCNCAASTDSAGCTQLHVGPYRRRAFNRNPRLKCRRTIPASQCTRRRCKASARLHPLPCWPNPQQGNRLFNVRAGQHHSEPPPIRGACSGGSGTARKPLAPSDLDVAPAATRLARIYIVLRTPLLPPSDLALYNANTENRLLLIYFDRACTLQGAMKWPTTRDRVTELWNVQVSKPGLQWVERRQERDGTYTWNLAPSDLVPMIISSPSVSENSQFEVPGIERAPHSVRLRVADQGEWITASESCKVWNAYPRTNESVSWSGTCRAGYGEGVGEIVWQRDGEPESTSQVTPKHGKPNGPATHRRPDGSVLSAISLMAAATPAAL